MYTNIFQGSTKGQPSQDFRTSWSAGEADLGPVLALGSMASGSYRDNGKEHGNCYRT